MAGNGILCDLRIPAIFTSGYSSVIKARSAQQLKLFVNMAMAMFNEKKHDDFSSTELKDWNYLKITRPISANISDRILSSNENISNMSQSCRPGAQDCFIDSNISFQIKTIIQLTRNEISFLIGKRGARISETRRRSMASINVMSEDIEMNNNLKLYGSNRSLQIVEISGNSNQVRDAIDIIQEMLLDIKK